MFPRNVKQIVRQVSPSFDERAYGFASLVDLLRAAQKEGVVRVERDRRGGIRVFDGPQLAAAASTPPGAVAAEAMPGPAPVVVVDAEVIEESVVIDAPVVAEAETVPAADVVEAVEAPAPRRRRSPKRATTRRAASAR